MKCCNCKQDINEKEQDNMSPYSGFPICEDCFYEMTKDEWRKIKENYEQDSD